MRVFRAALFHLLKLVGRLHFRSSHPALLDYLTKLNLRPNRNIMKPSNKYRTTCKRAIWPGIFAGLIILSITSVHAQQRTTPPQHLGRPLTWGVTNPNLQHIQILQKQITQLQWQISEMRYRLRSIRLTPEGYRRYMAEIRALEQRVNYLGWLLYRLLDNRH